MLVFDTLLTARPGDHHLGNMWMLIKSDYSDLGIESGNQFIKVRDCELSLHFRSIFSLIVLQQVLTFFQN